MTNGKTPYSERRFDRMGDRFWGRIEFPARMIDPEVREALEGEGVEFDGDNLVEKRMQTYDPEVYVDDGILSLDDQEASYGMFDDLERLLRKKGIPFDRQIGQAYEYTPERVIFRPAHNDVPALDLTLPLFDDEPIVLLRDLRNLLPQGIEAIRAYLDKEYPTYLPLSDYVKAL
jgi:hypothetical protein